MSPHRVLIESLRRHHVRIRVNKRPSANADARNDKYFPKESKLLKSKAAEEGQPQVLPDIPVGFWEIGALPSLALLDDQHSVSFFRQAHRGY